MTVMSRRGLLGGLGLVLAAPAIVRASSPMPVKQMVEAPRYSATYTVRDDMLDALQMSFLYLYTRPEWAILDHGSPKFKYFGVDLARP